jgi:hypothetical protein
MKKHSLCLLLALAACGDDKRPTASGAPVPPASLSPRVRVITPTTPAGALSAALIQDGLLRRPEVRAYLAASTDSLRTGTLRLRDEEIIPHRLAWIRDWAAKHPAEVAQARALGPLTAPRLPQPPGAASMGRRH